MEKMEVPERMAGENPDLDYSPNAHPLEMSEVSIIIMIILIIISIVFSKFPRHLIRRTLCSLAFKLERNKVHIGIWCINVPSLLSELFILVIWPTVFCNSPNYNLRSSPGFFMDSARKI